MNVFYHRKIKRMQSASYVAPDLGSSATVLMQIRFCRRIHDFEGNPARIRKLVQKAPNNRARRHQRPTACRYN